MIIHISGPQGSGKTTLGQKLKKRYKNKIYVKELDELFSEFMNQHKINNYQKYIYHYIEKHNNRPLLFTGLNADRCLGPIKERKKLYNLRVTHKFFIDLPDNKVLEQRFMRQVQKLNDRKELFFELFLKNPKEIGDKINRYVNIYLWKNEMKICRNIYKKRKYKFGTPQKIVQHIAKLLN